MTRLVTTEQPARVYRRFELSRASTPKQAARTAWRLRWLWVVLVASGGFFWASSLRVPAGPAAGASFEGKAPLDTARRTFRVGAYNIHGGRGLDRERNLQRTAEALRGIDIAGMNEVIGPWLGTVDQCQQIGEMLGITWLYAPTESRWWDGSFGNGMLSALPVVSWQRIPFPLAGSHTYRNMVLATMTVDDQNVQVLLTHLDSRDSARRREQLRTAGRLFLSLAEPAVFIGDLNTTADDPELARLIATPGVIDAVAAGAKDVPTDRIDWILVRGLRSVAAGRENNGASDHSLWWAELELID